MKRFIAAMAAFAVMITGHAFAANFTTKDVENFIGTMQSLEGLDSRYPDLGLNMAAPGGMNIGDVISENGRLTILSALSTRLNEHPQAATEIQRAVKSNGFSSIDQWAKIGDAIITTYTATQIDDQDLQQMEMMKQMDPAMLDSLPPQAKQAFEAMTRLQNVKSSVPQDDIDTLMPMMTQLERAMDN